MFGRIHQLLPAVVGVLGFLEVATARMEAAYLPQAGPLPLRFRLPPPPVTEQVKVPVVPPLAAPIALPAPPMPPTLPEPPRVEVVKPAAVTNRPPLEYNARESVSVTAPSTAPNGVISPQMLIKYFTSPASAPTNAPSAGVVASMGFTPPPLAKPAQTPPSASKAASNSP